MVWEISSDTQIGLYFAYSLKLFAVLVVDHSTSRPHTIYFTAQNQK